MAAGAQEGARRLRVLDDERVERADAIDDRGGKDELRRRRVG
jgi:hypothetical protein